MLVEDDSGVRLVAPFYSVASDHNILRLIGDPRGDYNNLVFARGDRAAIETLFSWMRRQSFWETARLRNLPSESSMSSYFQYVCGSDPGQPQKFRSWMNVREFLVYRYWQDDHPNISRARLVELGDLLTGRNYRKHINWFSGRGGLTYRCVTDVSECMAILPFFTQMHIAEWGFRGQKSMFLSREHVEFYSQLIQHLCPDRSIRFDVLKLGEQIIAAHFGFTWAGRVYYYKTCFSPEYASRSPGKLLFGFIANDALANGAEELDLLKGAEEYKAKYASGVRRTASLQIYRTRRTAMLERFGLRQQSV